jgi:hypothetical protein
VVGCGSNRFHLGVRRWVVELLAAVMAAPNDLALMGNHGAYRYFAHAIRLSGQAQGLLHKIFIFFGFEHFSKIGQLTAQGESPMG